MKKKAIDQMCLMKEIITAAVILTNELFGYWTL
uniref:Uncharacterized protein n=1 Tax=Rhizophora mucronata TaxID=61149 RepID=A0A2P2Q7R8_RHIMU